MKAQVKITLKKSVLDPQGQTIQKALHSLGKTSIADVRVGKYIEMNIDENDRGKVDELLEEICQKLLANLVIEEYKYEIISEEE